MVLIALTSITPVASTAWPLGLSARRTPPQLLHRPFGILEANLLSLDWHDRRPPQLLRIGQLPAHLNKLKY
jgi:hypothetical protein